MSPHGPNDAKGNDGKDEQRLEIGAELEYEQEVHGQERNAGANSETYDRLVSLLLLPLPFDRYGRKFLLKLADEIAVLEGAGDLLRVRFGGIEVGGHRDRS